MTESSLLQEKTAAENQRLKSLDSENRVQNLRQVDGLQVKVRDLEELLCDQRAMVQEQWRFAREHEFNKSALEEKLQMQTEALRITSMRLQDALQQHQNEAVRHQQELNSLKLQLALEKKKGGGTAAEVEPSEAKDPQPETSMEFLEQRVKDLQEERNILVGKLEVKEVQYHLQLDDLRPPSFVTSVSSSKSRSLRSKPSSSCETICRGRPSITSIQPVPATQC
ncbi:unnamed protein product [Effrenium voratum]|nr:unnamed protein product [Effrenium voratum]CAJ1421357.1 unnamed protein product [Effrenium voratum]